MNSLSIVGRLGSDAEVRQLAGGSSVANFNVAVTTGFGDREATMWFRCAIFGKRAEGGLIQYLVKGTQVAISGELSENKWTTNEGVERTTLEISVNSIDLVGGKPAESRPATPAQPVGNAVVLDDEISF